MNIHVPDFIYKSFLFVGFDGVSGARLRGCASRLAVIALRRGEILVKTKKSFWNGTTPYMPLNIIACYLWD